MNDSRDDHVFQIQGFFKFYPLALSFFDKTNKSYSFIKKRKGKKINFKKSLNLENVIISTVIHH